MTVIALIHPALSALRREEVDDTTRIFLKRRFGPRVQQGALRILARGALSTMEREIYDHLWDREPND